ncbi:HNH endonuclease [Oceanobacillus arenosus]|uniref:HNH endonuclease n=1 Tax=Oceanobacillus arenosus TaxID=1229153 RepID=A0A3D8PM05_9BACI|nr:HNH endonuclease signature motif containing protein [Oceanobacillus arenosus]RDW17024.1 HNH endonuclease [Oceanobacillus arenosus]
MSRRYSYSKEEIDFVRSVAPGKYNDEIAALFTEMFGSQVTAGQMKGLKSNHKIKSYVPTRRVTEDDGLFNKEQQEFIKENVKGLLNQDLANLVNEKFDLSITAQQVKAWKNRRHISSGLKGSEGMDPPNKGTKGLYNVGGNKTSFKPGQKPVNYKPVGSERIDSKDGYTLVKVQDNGDWHERWRHKHVVLWEKENGPVPEGHAVLFADQNKQNITLENLILVSRRQLAIINKNDLAFNDAESTKLGLTMADIHLKIGERKRKDEAQ